jgi:tetraacyldisaccharide 4'-kinase
MYGLIVRIRNAMYGHGRGIHRVALPVISVGNITVGGTGKTPLVTWIVRRLREAGHRPAIVMRGYASVDPSKADEVVEYHEQLQEIDIVVGGDRYANINAYLAQGGQADCFVMDDGFQHRRLHRDLDIVVLDFLRDALEDQMLPAGWLREPIEGLKRADVLVVSHSPQKNPMYAEKVDALAGKEPIAWTTHHWTKLHLHHRHGKTAEGLDWLMGKKVAVRLGIGYPGPVIEALVRLGAKISLQLPAGDHQPFTDSEIEGLIQASKNVDAIVMTLKDWVKAREIVDLAMLQCPVVVPNLVLEIVDGDKELESLILSVFKEG